MSRFDQPEPRQWSRKNSLDFKELRITRVFQNECTPSNVIKLINFFFSPYFNDDWGENSVANAEVVDAFVGDGTLCERKKSVSISAHIVEGFNS